jgi:ATP-binding cassette, subfamily B, bacterial HlyB/CyaB
VDWSEVQVLAGPLVRQRLDNDCGLAALATVAAHHGRQFDPRDLWDELAHDRDGTDLLSLSRLAESLGFEARGVRASYDGIASCDLPAIAHWRTRFGAGHFVVLQRWAADEVVVADPAMGRRKLSRRAFCRRSSGYFLLVEPRG